MARAILLIDLKHYLKTLEEKVDFFHNDVDDETLDQMKEVAAAIKGNYDMLDRKVNYTDIVDDLNSDDAALPLSARQGKELKRLIDAKPSGSGGSGGAGGIIEETDPTVPDWAKQPNKPSYEYWEVGADQIGAAATVQKKLDAATGALNSHMGDTSKHISSTEREKWNAYKGIKSVAQTVEGEGSNADNVLTITLTDDFVTNFVVKNGDKGDKGDDGTDGTSVTISDITESTEDGGGNVIAFSDGKTITIKNGSKGDKGDKGDDGTDYVLTAADKEVIADMATDVMGAKFSLGIGTDGQAYVYVNGERVGTGIPIYKGGVEGDVFGYVDANNNIVLRGNLTDGEYSVKYEMADGTVLNIGDLVFDSTVYYAISNSLTYCTNSNNATSIKAGESYSAKISANSGYALSSVKVVMGGTDISSTAVSGGTINIASVTGNVDITAEAKEIAVNYTNILTSGDYEVHKNKRWSATASAYLDCNGMISFHIPIADVLDKTIRFKGFTTNAMCADNHKAIWYSLKSDYSRAGVLSGTPNGGGAVWESTNLQSLDNEVYAVKVDGETFSVMTNVAYIAINMSFGSTTISAIPSTAIMTIDEPIS